jgi:hypothetical protein
MFLSRPYFCQKLLILVAVAMEFLARKMVVIILHKQYARLDIKIASLFCPLQLHEWENTFCICTMWRDCEEQQSNFDEFWVAVYSFRIFLCADGSQNFLLPLQTSRNFIRLKNWSKHFTLSMETPLFIRSLTKRWTLLHCGLSFSVIHVKQESSTIGCIHFMR